MQSNNSYQKTIKTKPAKEVAKVQYSGKTWARNNDKRTTFTESTK